MNRYVIASLAAVVVAAACQDMSTSPGTNADLAVRTRVSNPPPPPIDTGATLSFSASTQSAQTMSFTPTATCSGLPSNVVLPVTYLYDPNGNTGWLHVGDDPNIALDASANGMIRMRADAFGVQTFEGKGQVKVLIEGCELIVDLSSVTNQSHYGECNPVVIGDVAPTAAGERDQGCFFLYFDDVTLDGQDIGDAQMTPSPDCQQDSEQQGCSPFIVEPDID